MGRMDFRTAVGILGRQITTADIAEVTGMSPYSIRQARLIEGAPGYRTPPKDWEGALIRLARERVAELEKFIETLDPAADAD
jgi:hypothetical protein